MVKGERFVTLIQFVSFIPFALFNQTHQINEMTRQTSLVRG